MMRGNDIRASFGTVETINHAIVNPNDEKIKVMGYCIVASNGWSARC